MYIPRPVYLYYFLKISKLPVPFFQQKKTYKFCIISALNQMAVWKCVAWQLGKHMTPWRPVGNREDSNLAGDTVGVSAFSSERARDHEAGWQATWCADYGGGGGRCQAGVEVGRSLRWAIRSSVGYTKTPPQTGCCSYFLIKNSWRLFLLSKRLIILVDVRSIH
jgi:hypothetical protein